MAVCRMTLEMENCPRDKSHGYFQIRVGGETRRWEIPIPTPPSGLPQGLASVGPRSTAKRSQPITQHRKNSSWCLASLSHPVLTLPRRWSLSAKALNHSIGEERGLNIRLLNLCVHSVVYNEVTRWNPFENILMAAACLQLRLAFFRAG